MIRILFLFVSGLILLLSGSLVAETWEALESCRLLKKETYDGDSFHVQHQGKEYIFRLLYVDTPERKEMGLTKRTTEQANYWKIYKKDLYLLADEASLYTGKALSSPFTVQTRWEDARGNSSLPRYYAVVTTAERKDLADLLVANGLARIHGHPVDSPDGRPGKEKVKDLEKVEAEAKELKKGAWAFSRKGAKK
jgi:endonuclease YncB( thermonuclease family)